MQRGSKELIRLWENERDYPNGLATVCESRGLGSSDHHDDEGIVDVVIMIGNSSIQIN